MTPDRLEFFRNLLNSRLASLFAQAEGGMVELVEEKENLPDSIDLASSETDRDFNLRMRDRERKLIYKLKEAIARCEDGSYGECEICGEEVSEGRLMARPVTTHCIDCKTEAEQQERVRGA
ncbi:MAG: RNA polymerase-binding protein DksA [Myxococcales bacterium]|nr:RNA polymerase-binding protein DksA [Myxococcales bacterium]